MVGAAMASYSFVSSWRIEAPIDAVWRAINEIEVWPQWWRSVKQVTKLEDGDESGVGARWRFVYRSHLPYNLEFEISVSRVEPPRLSEGRSYGELVGVGLWQLSEDGPVTTVRYDWNVETTKAWMNLLAPLLRPVFSWNHNVSMRECSEGMARHLSARLIETSHVTGASR
jgi:hypothetical protein